MSGILIAAAGNLMWSPPPAPPPPPPPATVSLTATPNAVSGQWRGGSAPVYTGSLTLSPAGGVVPYTLGIQAIAGPVGFNIYVNPNVATGPGPWTVQFSFTGNYYMDTTYRATITDAVGNPAFADIYVSAKGSGPAP
jgi:hypothetical protein